MTIAACKVARADKAPAPIDESAPAKRVFVPSTGRMLSGGRATWPLDLPEMPWLKNTFANLSLDEYDGNHVIGTVELFAAPGLDPKACTIELLWGLSSKVGIQLRGAPSIETHDSGSRATWRFRAVIPGAPPAANAMAWAFCPNDVTFSSIEMFAPGPKMRAAYCKTKLASNKPDDGMIGTQRTFELRFACGALIRLKGRDLVDECRGDTLLSLDALGSNVTAGALAAGTPLSDDEIRRWHSRSASCSEVHLVAHPSFTAGARAPFAAFAKRAGGRLVHAMSRDGMRHR